jgi:hypothetical protein
LTPVRPKPVAEPPAQKRGGTKRRERVYFMAREGLIKIGMSSNVQKRMQEVSRGSSMIEGMTVGPVELLGTVSGGRVREKRLHLQFQDLRVGGEWFQDAPELREAIQELCR